MLSLSITLSAGMGVISIVTFCVLAETIGSMAIVSYPCGCSMPQIAMPVHCYCVYIH